MAQIPTSNISMTAIDTEVNTLATANNGLKQLHTDSISYTGGNATAVTNNTKADPDSIREFAGYVHTQALGASYTSNARHGTSDSSYAIQQSVTDTYSYMGAAMTFYRIRVVFNSSARTYTISVQRVNGTTTGYNTVGGSSSVTGFYQIGIISLPSGIAVDQIQLNRSKSNWVSSYVDAFPSGGSEISVSGQTSLTFNTTITANGNSVTYGRGLRYSGQKEEGSSSSHVAFDDFSITLKKGGYFDYTSPIFAVKTIHNYVRQSGGFGGGYGTCLHEDMVVWLEGKDITDFTPVKEVKVGDMVRTKDGRYTKVTKVITNHMREGYYNLFDGLKITGDHPIMHPLGSQEVTPENPWTRVDEIAVEKEYIEGWLPTVYIETEAGHLITYWQQPNSNDRWEGCFISADYAKL
jgi:hypothetical protein